MLYAGSDLSRQRLDVHVLAGCGLALDSFPKHNVRPTNECGVPTPPNTEKKWAPHTHLVAREP